MMMAWFWFYGSVLGAMICGLAEGAVRGTVVETGSERGVSEALVELLAGDSIAAATYTDSHGLFGFDKVIRGRFVVRVSKEGYIDVLSRLAASRSITVRGGEDVTLALSLVKSAVLAGRVVDSRGKPATRTAVIPISPEATGEGVRLVRAGRQARVDDTGNYRIFGLPPGQYLLAAVPDATRGTARDMDSAAAFYFPGVLDARKAEAITLHPGEVRNGLDFMLMEIPHFSVEGQVHGIDADWRNGSVTVALIPVQDYGQPLQMVDTDRGGRFLLRDVPAGSYRLTAGGPVVSRTAWGAIIGERARFGSRTVEVYGRNIDNADIDLHEAVTVRGRVSSGDKVPRDPKCYEGGEVLLIPLELLVSAPSGGAKVDKRGEFVFAEVAPGSYQIRARLPSGCFVTEVRVANEVAVGGTIAVSPGEVRRLDVIVTMSAGIVQGCVQDNDAAATEAYVTLVPVSPDGTVGYDDTLIAQTDSNGAYVFDGVGPGLYHLSAHPKSEAVFFGGTGFALRYGERAVKLVIQPGEQARADLQVLHLEEDGR
jgi:hypothetical protein